VPTHYDGTEEVRGENSLHSVKFYHMTAIKQLELIKDIYHH